LSLTSTNSNLQKQFLAWSKISAANRSKSREISSSLLNYSEI